MKDWTCITDRSVLRTWVGVRLMDNHTKKPLRLLSGAKNLHGQTARLVLVLMVRVGGTTIVGDVSEAAMLRCVQWHFFRDTLTSTRACLSKQLPIN
jgi:hypothetical protein